MKSTVRDRTEGFLWGGVLGRNSRVGSPARNLLGVVIVTSSHRSLLVKVVYLLADKSGNEA